MEMTWKLIHNEDGMDKWSEEQHHHNVFLKAYEALSTR